MIYPTSLTLEIITMKIIQFLTMKSALRIEKYSNQGSLKTVKVVTMVKSTKLKPSHKLKLQQKI